MSRASAGFSDFFPSAPRAAKDKAKERQRAKSNTLDSPSLTSAHQHESSAVTPHPRDEDRRPIGSTHASGSGQDLIMTDTLDVETQQGDLLNGVGSASSHTSTVSSVFSAPAQQTTNITPHGGINNFSELTPLTSIDSSSPRRPSSPHHSRPTEDPSKSRDQIVDNSSYTMSKSQDYAPAMAPITQPSRKHARDPNRSLKGQKIIYNPELDHKISKQQRREGKPKYKEFGLEDDPPPKPQDPRLAKGGKYAYINTDFHNPRSRLRDSMYMLKPYPWVPKTSVGRGPPTQIMVTGFDPLGPFAMVTALFYSYGDIAESSNKMHPMTGTYLGFATFRFRDSRPGSSRPATAVEAARRAVRGANGEHRVGKNPVVVEFDPDGVKSSKKLAAILEAEKKASDVEKQALIDAAPKIPTGPRMRTDPRLKMDLRLKPELATKDEHISRSGPRLTPSHLQTSRLSTSHQEPNKSFGTLQSAPSGPSQRQLPPHQANPQTAYPTAPNTSRSRGVEVEPVIKSLGNRPFIFVPKTSVPVIAPTIYHMIKRLKPFRFDDLRADRSGYYIIFENSHRGRFEAQGCYKAVHGTTFFTYNMSMQLHLSSSGEVPADIPAQATNQHAVATRSDMRPHIRSHDRQAPEDRDTDLEAKNAEKRKLEEDAQRAKDDAADLEEEIRQRAENVDPSSAAVEAISLELKDYFLKRIKEDITADIIKQCLAAHAEKKRRQEEESSDLLSLYIPPGDQTPPVGTPNSHNDPLDQRRTKLSLSTLPRIPKARNEASKRLNVAFVDPFGRTQSEAPRPRRNPVVVHRPLQDRFNDVEDPDSEDDAPLDSFMRDTEEPESRPTSRMSMADDSDVDDSMTEANSTPMDIRAETKEDKVTIGKQNTLRRHKKTDEEIFGIRPDVFTKQYTLLGEDASGADSVMSDADTLNTLDDTDAVSTQKTKPSKLAKRKRSKKQIFEEREALKRQKEEEMDDMDDMDVDDSDKPGNIVEDTKEMEGVVQRPVIPTAFADPQSCFGPSDKLKPLLDIAGWQSLVTTDADILMMKKAIANLENSPEPAMIGGADAWAWRQSEIKAKNRDGFKGVCYTDLVPSGYYVHNKTGCALTEGVRKISQEEKNQYLPHRIKVKELREERIGRAKKDGRDIAAEAAETARIAAENSLSRGDSRTSRVNNRRFAIEVSDQQKNSGQSSDLFKFNELKRRKKKVRFARSAIHDWGLYTDENIPKDDMIIEYVGEIVSQLVADMRERKYRRKGIGSSYLFRIDEDHVIDATNKGGIARFINHSCMPNCTAKIIKVGNTNRIVIYALRNISKNEELTYDYKFEREIGSDDRIPCLCGTVGCKLFLN